MKCTAPERHPISRLLRTGLFVGICHFIAASALASASTAGIRVQGPGGAPQLMFACCDHDSLLSNANVIANLKSLHAGLAIGVPDFTPERAELVRRLNRDGIPVIASLSMPPDQGLYFNAENASEAAARFAAFDAWSREQGLRWDGVGLDIEPNFAELASLKGHSWRLLTTFLRRAVDLQRMHRAQRVYSALIANIRSRGYFVLTYQLPYLPVERETHSSLLDRMLGTVDVRGDQEVLMLYSSYAGPAGAAIIWKLGPDAQSIAICCTDGDPAANPAVLDWSRFSRDLTVAGHFSHLIGVYNLEGCVRQGFLPRLKTMNWSQSVTIPAVAIRAANRRLRILRLVLWISSHLLYLVVFLVLVIALIAWRWRIRKMKRNPSI
ncbi:MAG: hypothetical protein WCB00_01715 [Candidatus Acidiferrales bacterium]